MKTDTAIFVVIAFAVIVGVGYYAIGTPATTVPSTATTVSDTATPREVTTPSDDVTNPDTVTAVAEEVVEASETSPAAPPAPAPASQPGTYLAYDADAIAQSDAEHIVLFFHASWCPSCRALDADITANAASIPAKVEIYKVDYDTATELKRQYGVTTQHSIIEIAADGTAKSNISHGLTLNDLLATL